LISGGDWITIIITNEKALCEYQSTIRIRNKHEEE
jgi:hypothetical protein